MFIFGQDNGPSFARVAQGIEVLRTPFRAPRANAVCERFLGSVRRECLDFFLILSERHLHRVMKEYQAYFNDTRPHQGIEQRIPCQSERDDDSPPGGKIVSLPVLGGLHHDYFWQASDSESLPRAA
jgi:transposase InsO family protein